MDSQGRIRVWTIWIEHHSNKSIVFTRYGLNGASIDNLAVARTEFVDADHYTKSCSHYNSSVRYMTHRKGYTESIPITRPFRPMLLHRWKNFQHSTPQSVFIQPKLRGFRCLASSSWLQSRTGERFYLPHLQQALSGLSPEIVLDGELYCHGMTEQSISSHVKRPMNPHPDSYRISFFVFDIVEESLTYAERWEALQELFNSQPLPPPSSSPYLEALSQYYLLGSATTSPIRPHPAPMSPAPTPPTTPPTTPTPTPPTCQMHPSATEPHLTSVPGVYLLATLPIVQAEVDEHFNYYLAQSYEGAVIRNPYSHYQIDTRSPGVLKYKPLEKINVKIMDVIPCDRAPRTGKLVLQNPRGGVFICQYKAQQHKKEYLLRNRTAYIGKLCAVEFEDFSDENKPLKPVGVHIYE